MIDQRGPDSTFFFFNEQKYLNGKQKHSVCKMLLWVTVRSLFLPSTCCVGGRSNSGRQDPLGVKKLGTHMALIREFFQRHLEAFWFPRAQYCKLLMWSVNLVKLIHCATQQPWGKVRSAHTPTDDFRTERAVHLWNLRIRPSQACCTRPSLRVSAPSWNHSPWRS